MRDYSLDTERSKTFILKYEINDNKITVYFASGEEYIIFYSKENEKSKIILCNEAWCLFFVKFFFM